MVKTAGAWHHPSPPRRGAGCPRPTSRCMLAHRYPVRLDGALRMKQTRNRIGTISLVASLAGFLLVTFQPWIPLDHVLLFRALSLKGLLSAFFDASMVGALADWFAVTALFRSPLGVKLPHTDILAHNKDAIAEAVPRFLTSFVSEEKVAASLGAVDFAAKVEALLREDGGGRDEINDFVRQRLAALIEAVAPAEGTGGDGLRIFVGEAASFALERLDPAAVVASTIFPPNIHRVRARIAKSAITSSLRVNLPILPSSPVAQAWTSVLALISGG